MATEELMLNQNVNLNLQYNNKLYKVKINVMEGFIMVQEIISDDKYNIVSITDLSCPTSEVVELNLKEKKKLETRKRNK